VSGRVQVRVRGPRATHTLLTQTDLPFTAILGTNLQKKVLTGLGFGVIRVHDMCAVENLL